MKNLFVQLEAKMRQTGDSGSVGFASVVAIIQRLIDSSTQKVKEYDALLRNHTDHCEASKLVLERKFNESMRMIDHNRAKLQTLNSTFINNTNFLDNSRIRITKLENKIQMKNNEYEIYNMTKTKSIKTLTEAISSTTDMMTSVTFITSLNTVEGTENLIGKDDIKKYNEKVAYFVRNAQDLVKIASFYDFKNFTKGIEDAIELLKETKIESAREQSQIQINNKLTKLKDILEVLLKTAANNQSFDLLFQTKISNLNDVLSTQTMMKNTYIERKAVIKASIRKTREFIEKLLDYHQSLKKHIKASGESCDNVYKNLFSIKNN